MRRQIAPVVGSVGKLAQDHVRLQQTVLGRFVVAGFDRVFTLLLELPRVEELFAFIFVGGTDIAYMREFQGYLPLQLDEICRRGTRNCWNGSEGRRHNRCAPSMRRPANGGPKAASRASIAGRSSRIFSESLTGQYPVQRRARRADQVSGAAPITLGLFERPHQSLLDHVVKQEPGNLFTDC